MTTTKKDFYLEVVIDNDGEFCSFNSSFSMRRYLWADRVGTIDIDDVRDTFKKMYRQSKDWNMITVSILSCNSVTKYGTGTESSFRFVKRYEDVKYGKWDGYKYDFDGHQESFKDILKLLKWMTNRCTELHLAQSTEAVSA